MNHVQGDGIELLLHHLSLSWVVWIMWLETLFNNSQQLNEELLI
jgi:hypothetical protein